MGTTTIAALATAPASSAIAVIRLSGSNTKEILRKLFRSRTKPHLNPRKLIYGDFIDSQTKEIIDRAMTVFFPSPSSFTGEDMAELQLHGNAILVQKVLRSLYQSGIQPAEPGEFTKRAFLNGKIDLIQAESIASDLIAATSERSLRIATEQLEGRLSHAINLIGEPLRDILAELEASVDFPEEGIQPSKLDAIVLSLENTKKRIYTILETHTYGSLVRDGFRVLLCGRPNAGKSSILNLLLEKQRAIVTDVPGTTRDIIEEEAIIGGYKFVFCDSAGLTDTEDIVEKIGIELAKERIPWADLVILVADSSNAPEQFQQIIPLLKGQAKKIWMVTNKIDLNPKAFENFFCESDTCAQNFYISAKTKHGMDSLNKALVEEVASCLTDRGESNVIVTSERQRHSLENALNSISQAIDGARKSSPVEIISVDIRYALKSLEEIIGKTYSDDILGRIFSKFCIGK